MSRISNYSHTGFRVPCHWLVFDGARLENCEHRSARYQEIRVQLLRAIKRAEQHGGRPYVVPDTAFQGQVMLPTQQLARWLSTQPESVLSSDAVRRERNGIDYLPAKADFRSSVQFMDKIVNQSLSRNLDLIQPEMYEEIRDAVDETMGMDNASWQEINLSQTMSVIISRTCTRVLFGLSLSRNHVYLCILRLFLIFMGASSLVIGQMPPWIIRPVIGVLLHIPTAVLKNLAGSYIRPFIEERFQTGESDKQDQEEKSFVAQSVQSADKSKLQFSGCITDYLVNQFLFLAFAAIATTSAAATNIFLDILSVESRFHLYETLRSEAAPTFESESDWTSARSVTRLTKMDSAIRESLRMNPLQCRGLLKKVMPNDGIILPDGSYLPQGTWVGLPMRAIHYDDKLYPNPQEYDPYRFSRLKKVVEMEGHNEIPTSSYFDAAQPSDKFFSFSYGRSVCPGRWFAVRLLKLMISYVVIHYDIKPLSRRPRNLSFGDASIPALSITILVRRRK
ncbi:hypothetical protein AJ79_03334 [Helicocarpus griseus UAMH5409]|uniref:Cytochrome P450 n=1 Tax=Helicocarpus griseus UAMH5409 TaxID=1447875 RepID=A0A2B7XYB8_9EURO|nr:hypothetical protein AJ79_03334 [Helicocarpus griseus UAMH5409]